MLNLTLCSMGLVVSSWAWLCPLSTRPETRIRRRRKFVSAMGYHAWNSVRFVKH